MKDIIHHGTACIYQFCGTPKKNKQILLLFFFNMEKKQQLIALHNVHLVQLYKCLRDIPIIVCKEDWLWKPANIKVENNRLAGGQILWETIQRYFREYRICVTLPATLSTDQYKTRIRTADWA